MIYWVKVRRLGFFSLPRWYRCEGHMLTNGVSRFLKNEKGENVRQVVFEGPYRLELTRARGGVVVFGDASKIVYTLGKSWFNRMAKEAEQESGGAVKLAK
jgi:hypothetical protein